MLVEPVLDALHLLRRAFAGEASRDSVPIGTARGWIGGALAVGHALSTRQEFNTLSRIMHRAVEYTGTPLMGTDATRRSVAATFALIPWKSERFSTG